MDLQLLRQLLPAECTLHGFETAGSTNDIAKELARSGAPDGTVVTALRQTAGRGRRGRSFLSPEGGIYLSLLLRPRLEVQHYGLVTPAAAVAVADAVEALRGVSCGIKWVNDLILHEKKLCGILTELCGDAVIIGVGLNVTVPSGGFAPEIASVATALFDAPPPAGTAEQLTARMVQRLQQACAALPDRAFLQAYRARSTLLGRQITVFPVNGTAYTARAVAIDDDAGLVVEHAGGTAVLRSGEVSVR